EGQHAIRIRLVVRPEGAEVARMDPRGRCPDPGGAPTGASHLGSGRTRGGQGGGGEGRDEGGGCPHGPRDQLTATAAGARGPGHGPSSDFGRSPAAAFPYRSNEGPRP